MRGERSMKRIVSAARPMIKYPQRRYFMGTLIFVILIGCAVILAKHIVESSNIRDLNKIIIALTKDLEETNKRLSQTEKENIELRKQTAGQEKRIDDLLKSQLTRQKEWVDSQHEIKKQILNEIEKHLYNRTACYKWLSPLITDIKLLAEDRLRDDADFVKYKRNSSEQLRIDVLNRRIQVLSSENNNLTYILEHIKKLIPGIDEIIEDDSHWEITKL